MGLCNYCCISHGVHRSGALVACIVFSIEDGAPRQRDLNDSKLLAAVHPHFAVISVRARNTYGHPGKEVLVRLAEIHVLTYRTDFDGAVTLYLDGATVAPVLPGFTLPSFR